MSGGERPGALVLSLDFEMAWGEPDGAAVDAGATGRVVEATLDLFEAYGMAATWAAVGALFARDRDEWAAFRPTAGDAPAARGPEAAPGTGDEPEADGRTRFAAAEIERIRRTPRQEVASHTFAHYLCGEPDASPEAFRADLRAARRIAAARGIDDLRSLVFPRNQVVGRYLAVAAEEGFVAYRGNPPWWGWRVEDARRANRPARRAARLLDDHLPLGADDTVGWDEVAAPGGMANVRASRMLRPWTPPGRALAALRRRRIAAGIRAAARRGRIYHLWWHPRNLAPDAERGLDVVRAALDAFAAAREAEGMESLAMGEVADRVLGVEGAGSAGASRGAAGGPDRGGGAA